MNHQTYVLGFLFSDEGDKVALIRKNKPEWQSGKLNGIGGKVEHTEVPLQAMRREFEEETGSPLEAWERFACMQGQGWTVHAFRAFSTEALERCRTMEQEQVIIVQPRDLFFFAGRPYIFNLNWLIPLALDKGSNSEGGPRFTEVRYP